MKRELQRVDIPGEFDARRRTWEIVRAAYLEREPVSWPRRHARELALAAAAVPIVAAAVTAPGRSVVNSIRDAVGRERVVGVRNAQSELVRLPAPGRLLVQSSRGAWVVQRDGSRRLLGRYSDASWSPHGKFVAGVLHDRTLVALEPNGTVRWEKPHGKRLALPRWSFEGYRIAYFAGSTLRVIVGNGTGDRTIGPADPVVAPAWKPQTHVVAYVEPGGAVRVADADRRAPLLRVAQHEPVRSLQWSSDGHLLLVVRPQSVTAYTPSGKPWASVAQFGLGIGGASFRPNSHEFAFTFRERFRAGHSTVCLSGRGTGCLQHVFEGAASFDSLTWSPDGSWLAIGWPAADQLVFVRVGRPPNLDAFSNVTRQFLSRTFPDVAGWSR
jgi:WD40 repeat protein